MTLTMAEQATHLGHRPDWWLQAAADAIRTTHHRIRAGHDHQAELMWLAVRIEHLLYLAERSTSGGGACDGE